MPVQDVPILTAIVGDLGIDPVLISRRRHLTTSTDSTPELAEGLHKRRFPGPLRSTDDDEVFGDIVESRVPETPEIVDPQGLQPHLFCPPYR